MLLFKLSSSENVVDHIWRRYQRVYSIFYIRQVDSLILDETINAAPKRKRRRKRPFRDEHTKQLVPIELVEYIKKGYHEDFGNIVRTTLSFFLCVNSI